MVLGHAYEPTIPGAPYVGVDVFFVLSGYLITTLLLAEHDRRGRIDLRRFYERRALRLLPALYVVLAVYAAIALLGPPGERTARFGAIAAAALYVSNWLLASAVVHPTDLQHTWSLALEEQFYLLWPLLLSRLLRARDGAANAARWLMALLVAALAGRWYVAHVDDVFGDGLYFSPIVWVDALIIGCLLATACRRGLLGRRPVPAGFLVVAAVVLLATSRGGAARPLIDGGITMVALAAAVLVLVAVEGSGRVARALEHPLLIRLGTLSYALYLWHFLLRGFLLRALPGTDRWLVGLLVIVGSLAIAEVSYRFVERPFLRVKDRLR